MLKNKTLKWRDLSPSYSFWSALSWEQMHLLRKLLNSWNWSMLIQRMMRYQLLEFLKLTRDVAVVSQKANKDHSKNWEEGGGDENNSTGSYSDNSWTKISSWHSQVFVSYLQCLPKSCFYRFTISDSTEYFVKFEVPEDMVEIYEQNPERHIFQVNPYNVL